jgi:hypothetical protein
MILQEEGAFLVKEASVWIKKLNMTYSKMLLVSFGTKENFVFYLLILIRAKYFGVQIGNKCCNW